jgi:hypothetical protein
MKIYKSGYRSHWFSPYKIIEYAFFWTAWSRCGRSRGMVDDKDFVDHPAWVDRAVDYLNPISRVIQWVLDLVHPRIDYVKIDYYDTWSFDHTLADIILPGLKQLKETKHGAPFTEDSDVPEYLRSHMAQPKEHEWDTDSLHFMRWDWILDEMIWAFEQKVTDDADSKFFDHSAYEKGSGKTNHDEWFDDMTKGVSRIKYDEAGHKAWQDRKANGFRLFGRYFENLWD